MKLYIVYSEAGIAGVTKSERIAKDISEALRCYPYTTYAEVEDEVFGCRPDGILFRYRVAHSDLTDSWECRLDAECNYSHINENSLVWYAKEYNKILEKMQSSYTFCIFAENEEVAINKAKEMLTNIKIDS